MKRLLMEDANKLYSDPCAYEVHKRKIEDAEYKEIRLDEAQFRNLVFMETNKWVWDDNQALVNKLTPECEPRTLKAVAERIRKVYPHDLPIKIFKRLSEDEPWFDGCFIMSARFDWRLLGELKIRDVNTKEKKDSPSALYYLEDGNHRALVYYMFLHFGVIKEYKSVRAIWSKDWAHIFPWGKKP